MLTFVSTLVGMLYFKENFSYDKAGMSLFAGWIAFALSALLVAVASFKVYIAHGENKERRKEKEQLAKQSIYERSMLKKLPALQKNCWAFFSRLLW